MSPTERATTLLELVVTLAVVALAASLLLPRLGDARGWALDGAVRRLGDGVAWARERAILGGRPLRVAVDVDRGTWAIGAPARDATGVVPDPSPVARPTALPAGVRVRAVVASGAPVVRGVAALDLDPAGDPLPARIELGDAHGRIARVVVPAGGGRPVVEGAR